MSTQCAFSATRVALRRTTTSALRCTSEVSQRLPAAATRTARPATQARRHYGAPAYQSYSLPTLSTPLPPRAEAQETALPIVNETRPPKQAPVQQAQPETIDPSTTTLEMPPRKTPKMTTTTTTPNPPEATTAAAPAPAAKRARPKLRARKAAMKLTPAAVEQLRMMHEDPEPKLIKVGVRNRGCSGLAYHLAWVDKAGPFDEEVVQDGVRVLIDSKALFSIIGSEMDWVEDKLSQKFVFKNPNIKEECGCGESFMV